MRDVGTKITAYNDVPCSTESFVEFLFHESCNVLILVQDTRSYFSTNLLDIEFLHGSRGYPRLVQEFESLRVVILTTIYSVMLHLFRLVVISFSRDFL